MGAQLRVPQNVPARLAGSIITWSRRILRLMRIYLVRHCAALGQEPDAELTDEGRAQAERLADFLSGRPVDAIVSSPFRRAVATIRPLAERLGLEIRVDDRLRERVLSAEPVADWMERLEASFHDLDLRLPGGESSREAMARGVSVIEELIGRPHRAVVVVTHGNLMSLILKRYDASFGFEGWRRLGNPDVYELVASRAGVEAVARLASDGLSGLRTRA